MKGSPILPVILVGMTPLLVFTLIVLGIFFGPMRWEPPSLWSTEFGSATLAASNRVTSLSVGAEGLYAAGYIGLRSTASVNPTPSQLFISRYDLSHHQLWSTSVGNPEGSRVYGVAGGSDGVYAVGRLNNTVFVSKFGLQGSPIWNSNWTVTTGGGGGTFAYDISIGADGVYVTVDETLSNSSYAVSLRGFDFQGNVLWNQPLDNLAGHVSSANNGLYVSGFRFSSGCSGLQGFCSGFVRKYSDTGSLVWNHLISCVCWPSGVSIDATGVYVAGLSSDYIHAFLAKYDWDGNQLWIQQFRPQSTAVGDLHMSVDSSGVYLAMNTAVGSYLAKYDGNGNAVWMFRIQSMPYAISVGENGVYIGGGNYGNSNAFLSEYSQSSSLIFFGLNPPFSFLTVGVLVALGTISTLWLRRRAQEQARNRLLTRTR